MRELSKQQINRTAAMGVKHMQSNSDIVAKVSKSQEMLDKAAVRPSKEELQQSSRQSLVDIPSKKLDSTTSTKETTCRNRRFCSSRSSVEYDSHNEINLQFVQKNKADEPFLSKRRVDGTNQQCKELLDALGIFNSNKELFINLLQDPNSLLIEHIEDPTDSRAKKQQMRTFFGGTLSENKIRDVGQSEEPVYIQDLKPCDRLPSEESDDSQSLERIVVLKANVSSSQHSAVRLDDHSSLQSHSNFINNMESDKRKIFSFRYIKRKMKQAMKVGRKEGENLSTNGMPKKTPQVCKASEDVSKLMHMDVTRKSSYGNIQFDGRRISKDFQDSEKKDQSEKGFFSRNGDRTASTSESTGNNVSQSAFNCHLRGKKCKKHGGDKVVERKMRAKPWGWMICFSDDDISPAIRSGSNIAGHMRYSHVSNKRIVCEKKSKRRNEERGSYESPLMDKVDASSAEKRGDDNQLHELNTESNISDFIFPDSKMHEDLIIEGSVKIVKDIAIVNQEGKYSFQPSSELDNTCKIGPRQSTTKTISLGETGNLELSIQDSPLEVQPSTISVDTFPSSSSRFHKGKDPNRLPDRESQPLPVSIHDQLLVDASSSPDFTLGTAGSSAEPLVSSEEYCSNGGLAQEALTPAISTSVDCCGSISDYVHKMLQASNLNWNESSTECYSSAWQQRSRLINEMKVFNGQLCGDCVLLFDYINEVLEDVFHRCFRCSPWLSSFKANFQASDEERALYHEVMKHVDWALLQQQPLKTLEHLVVKDLMRSRTWINSPTETEDIVTIITKSVLEELTIESFVLFDS